MGHHLSVAIRLALVTLVLAGVAYPLAVTGVAQLFFRAKAEGSLVRAHGRVVGSSLIGQRFEDAAYFWPRPSAAGTGYDAAASGGSNLGPTSRALADRVSADVAAVLRSTPGRLTGGVPVDLVTTSASGLDPDITLANAYVQARRVAVARGVDLAAVRALVEEVAQGRQFGILGEPRVNVLELNLALDDLTGSPS